MADKTPVEKSPKKEKTVEELLNRDNRMMRSPVLWFLLLGLPVVLSFYVALTKGDASGPEKAPAVQMAEGAPGAAPGGVGGVVEGAPDAPVVMELPAHDAQIPPVMEAPPCEFPQWIGKKVGGWIDQETEALKRPHRVMPPGAGATRDYSPGRINFDIDAAGIVTRIWCG